MDAAWKWSLYDGTEPYLFISYSHLDRERIFPLLRAAQRRGYRLWFDAGISAGDQWTDALARKITDCAVFVPFLSPAFDQSKYCAQELRHAKNEGRTVVPVFLTDKHALSSPLRFSLEDFQGFSADDAAPETFAAWLDAQSAFRPCRDAAANGTDDAAPVPPRASIVTATTPTGPSPAFGTVQK